MHFLPQTHSTKSWQIACFQSMAVVGQRTLRLIEEHGFAIVPRVLRQTEQRQFVQALGPVNGAGRRGVLGVATVAQWAYSTRLRRLVRPHLPSEPRPVRAIYFDKSTDANWLVPWHQDLTLACSAQVHAPGFGPWSTKEGVPHVLSERRGVAAATASRSVLDGYR